MPIANTTITNQKLKYTVLVLVVCMTKCSACVLLVLQAHCIIDSEIIH